MQLSSGQPRSSVVGRYWPPTQDTAPRGQPHQHIYARLRKQHEYPAEVCYESVPGLDPSIDTQPTVLKHAAMESG